MQFPDLSFEESLWEEGFTVIGIDEVGRGAFAGPVTVCGVVFPHNMSLQTKNKLLSLGINDSKKLSAKKREGLSLQIEKLALAHHVSFIDVSIINDIGIGKATFLGMKEVIGNLEGRIKNFEAKESSGQARPVRPFALVDGFGVPGLNIPQKGVVRGDSLSISIAAASILAKVARDEYMRQLDSKFSAYNFYMNKGYGTSYHRFQISQNGLTPHHRVVFCNEAPRTKSPRFLSEKASFRRLHAKTKSLRFSADKKTLKGV